MKHISPVVNVVALGVALGCAHKQAAQQPAPANDYSCFTYSSGDAAHKHATCTATRDCETVNGQVKGMTGMMDVTSCAATATVWCYHQGPQAGAEAGEVCQPSAADCDNLRKDALSANQPVDGECAQR